MLTETWYGVRKIKQFDQETTGHEDELLQTNLKR